MRVEDAAAGGRRTEVERRAAAAHAERVVGARDAGFARDGDRAAARLRPEEALIRSWTGRMPVRTRTASCIARKDTCSSRYLADQGIHRGRGGRTRHARPHARSSARFASDLIGPAHRSSGGHPRTLPAPSRRWISRARGRDGWSFGGYFAVLAARNPRGQFLRPASPARPSWTGATRHVLHGALPRIPGRRLGRVLGEQRAHERDAS